MNLFLGVVFMNKIQFFEWQLKELEDKLEKTRIKYLKSGHEGKLLGKLHDNLINKYQKKIKEIEQKLKMERMKIP